MDILTVIFFLLAFTLCLYTFRALKPNPGPENSAKLPPGPKPLPIIGNILELGRQPHRSLAKLAKIYGPLMHLKLGSLPTVIVSSSDIAKVVLQKHDQVFSNRGTADAIRALDHHIHSVAWMPVDNQWRKLRKICKENMFSNQRLELSQGLRRDKLQNLFDYVNKCCVNGEAVDIGKAAFTTSLNLMSATLFSEDFVAFGSESSTEFRDVVTGIMEIAGKPNLVDYFPVLKVVDPQGIFRKTTNYFRKCFDIFDQIIQKRMKNRGDSSARESKNDMLEALLDFRQSDESGLSFDEINHLLLDLFVAGTDTTSGTVEWAMAELIRNPDKMLKASSELRNVIIQNEHVQESDIPKLPYLQSVVKETFRLHPTLPFLLPHKANEYIDINGYIIPKSTQVLLNIWAIGRHSSTWPNADLFVPERFSGLETDFRGQHFELIPFGGGRRICLGLPLAHKMVHLMLATLIRNFDWKLESGMRSEELDMEEKFGLSLCKRPFLSRQSQSECNCYSCAKCVCVCRYIARVDIVTIFPFIIIIIFWF